LGFVREGEGEGGGEKEKKGRERGSSQSCFAGLSSTVEELNSASQLETRKKRGEKGDYIGGKKKRGEKRNEGMLTLVIFPFLPTIR